MQHRGQHPTVNEAFRIDELGTSLHFIAELLRDGPRSFDELASETNAHHDALQRLLTALSTVGICAPAGQTAYTLTELGAALDGSAEQSFKAWGDLRRRNAFEIMEWNA